MNYFLELLSILIVLGAVGLCLYLTIKACERHERHHPAPNPLKRYEKNRPN